jgi:hypothetical protein
MGTYGGGTAPHILTLAQMMSGRLHAPAAISPEKDAWYLPDRRLTVSGTKNGQNLPLP